MAVTLISRPIQDMKMPHGIDSKCHFLSQDYENSTENLQVAQKMIADEPAFSSFARKANGIAKALDEVDKNE